MVRFVRAARVRKVLINGIPPGSMALAERLHADAGVDVFVSYHGSFVQHVGPVPDIAVFAEMLDAARRGTVRRVGVVKTDLAPVLRRASIDAVPVLNRVDVVAALPALRLSALDGRTHIGVLGERIPGKNVVTQLMAVCMLDDAVVHVLRAEEALPYLSMCTAQIVVHDAMPHALFRHLLARMDVNLYVSLHECQPMVVLESVAAGVPCLVSDTTDVFALDSEMQSLLVVAQQDSLAAIGAAVARILEVLRSPDAEAFRQRLLRYVEQFNAAACRSLSAFLDEPIERLFSRGMCGEDLDALHASDALDASSSACADSGALTYDTVLADVRLASDRRSGTTDLQTQQQQQQQQQFRFTHVFVTYELPGLTPGGAGTLIAALAADVAYAGGASIILADLPSADCARWAAAAARGVDVPVVSSLTDLQEQARVSQTAGSDEESGARDGVLAVLSLRDFVSYEMLSGADDFVSKSLQWARGVEALCATLARVDAVEFFEYAGSASVLLARRALLAESRAHARPQVLVRVHGSLEAIDAAEGTQPNADRVRMYRMERFAMAAADAVLFPSASMRRFYVERMGVRVRAGLVSVPPVQRVAQMADVASARSAHAGDADGADGADGSSSGSMCDRAHGGRAADAVRFLVLGKVQRVKNPVLVVRAAVRAMRARPDLAMSFTFVGHAFQSVPGMPDPLVELVAEVPSELSERFAFVPPVPRRQLAALARCFDAGVIASTFESFNLAAHEQYLAGLPLVVSDFDGFADFFDARNAFVYRRGSAASLADALVRATEALGAREHGPAIAHAALVYPRALAAYACIACCVPPREAAALLGAGGDAVRRVRSQQQAGVVRASTREARVAVAASDVAAGRLLAALVPLWPASALWERGA